MDSAVSAVPSGSPRGLEMRCRERHSGLVIDVWVTLSEESTQVVLALRLHDSSNQREIGRSRTMPPQEDTVVSFLEN